MSQRSDVAECPVHHGYEPFVQKNPFPAYAALRAEEPVMYDERIGYWVVTRYDDVKAVFDDWAFSLLNVAQSSKTALTSS